MKRILAHLTFLAAGTLSAFVAQAAILNITEGPTGLTTDVPGMTITGSPDDWTVTAPAGFVFGFTGPRETSPGRNPQLALREPQNESSAGNLLTANQLGLTGFTSFTWQSDLTQQQFIQQVGKGNRIPIDYSGAVALVLANGNGTIGELISLNDTGDPPDGVPDTSPTLLLSGLGLLAIMFVARSSALARATQAA
jgi:hypothetical protein